MSTRHDPKYYQRHEVGFFEKIYLDFAYWIRINSLLKAIASKDKLTILDIGCGEGEFLNTLSSKKFVKYGIDIHTPKIISGFKFLLGKFEQRAIETRFDIITAHHVIEHVGNETKFVQKSKALLKLSGVLCLTTPNKNSWGYGLAKSKWFHYDYPHHRKLFDKQQLSNLLQREGFKEVKISGEFPGFPFDFIYTLRNLGPVYLLLAPIYLLIKIFIPETLLVICKK
jgi:2-polyprenyl-3-methyl-5-hydroxy-6-metoxy-1,4-benzoquinol methylase